MISKVLVAAVRVYQFTISPLLPPACRFYPSCSEYTARAIAAHGPLWGIWLGARRLLRCNPWHEGGVDMVPDRRPTLPFFKAHASCAAAAKGHSH